MSKDVTGIEHITMTRQIRAEKKNHSFTVDKLGLSVVNCSLRTINYKCIIVNAPVNLYFTNINYIIINNDLSFTIVSVQIKTMVNKSLTIAYGS